MSNESCGSKVTELEENSNIIPYTEKSKILVTQGDNRVLIKEVMSGVFKYTSNYTMSQNILPKILNIIRYKN